MQGLKIGRKRSGDQNMRVREEELGFKRERGQGDPNHIATLVPRWCRWRRKTTATISQVEKVDLRFFISQIGRAHV